MYDEHRRPAHFCDNTEEEVISSDSFKGSQFLQYQKITGVASEYNNIRWEDLNKNYSYGNTLEDREITPGNRFVTPRRYKLRPGQSIGKTGWRYGNHWRDLVNPLSWYWPRASLKTPYPAFDLNSPSTRIWVHAHNAIRARKGATMQGFMQSLQMFLFRMHQFMSKNFLDVIFFLIFLFSSVFFIGDYYNVTKENNRIKQEQAIENEINLRVKQIADKQPAKENIAIPEKENHGDMNLQLDALNKTLLEISDKLTREMDLVREQSAEIDRLKKDLNKLKRRRSKS